MNHALIKILHAGEVMIELALQRACAGEARRRHLAGEKIELVFSLRQCMRLTIFIELEPVFQMAHELVRRSQPRVFNRRQQFFIAQPRKRQQRTPVPDPRLAPSVQPLQALHQKFDVANAALRQLHVGAGSSAVTLLVETQFLVDARPRLGDGFDGAEVGGSPVDERLDEFEELAPRPRISCGDTRFDQHLQFPIAAARGVVLFRAAEGMANFAEAAIRTQTQIHPVAHAFLRVGGEHIGHAVGGCSEKLRGTGPIAGIHENQVDVRAVVEFTATEFAQSDYGKFRSRGRAALVRQFTPDGPPCGIHNSVGQIGKVFGGFRYIGVLQDIPKQDPKQLPAPEERQVHRAGNTVGGQGACQQFFILLGEKPAMKIARRCDLNEPFGEADYGIGEKMAEREDRHGATQRGGIFRDSARGLGSLQRQPVQEMYCIVRIGQRWQQRGYAAYRSR